MARIRSVHPGIFTDEAFVSLSSDAQVFLIGLWTEADDQGVFEWKPLTLRMRLRPTKDGAVEPLMEELTASNHIMSYEIGGRKLGAIRNFRKYQRPKSPNAIHLITPEVGNYVGLTATISEIDDDQPESFPPKGKISPQMEEGGKDEGKGKEKKKELKRADARGGYAFEGDVVKLSRKHFAQWTQAFGNLDLRAELTARDVWLSSPRANAGDRDNWFISTSKYLANRNAEAKVKSLTPIDETCPPEIYRGLQ